MAAEVIRIFSDIHYGDRSSRVTRLASLDPLAEGADSVILNGDSLDTRAGPNPVQTAEWRGELVAYFKQWGRPVTFLTGNHDPDFSPHHSLDLADGRIFITHGDILYPDIVPWGRDADYIRNQIGAHFLTRPDPDRIPLADRLAIFRKVALAVPQRHQSERNRSRYLRRLAADTLWPPWRVLNIVAAWNAFPRLADQFLASHRPGAQFMFTGHTHRPGIWRRRSGAVLINTGSLCRPFGGLAVDFRAETLQVRQIQLRGDEFRLGGVVAELRLRPPAR